MAGANVARDTLRGTAGDLDKKGDPRERSVPKMAWTSVKPFPSYRRHGACTHPSEMARLGGKGFTDVQAIFGTKRSPGPASCPNPRQCR